MIGNWNLTLLSQQRMLDTVPSIQETILRQCMAHSPKPWYPKLFAAESGVDRDALYAPLNDLRLANLIELTDWLANSGQGYILTAHGRDLCGDANFLAQVGKTPAPRATAETPVVREPLNRFERGEAARQAFFFQQPTRVVPILIVLNVVIFMATFAVALYDGVDPVRFLSGGDATVLAKCGALSVIDLAKDEWWRLFTSTFLHYGLLHLTLNMFSLYLLRRVETLWGSGRFLVMYLVCGICGSCAAVYFHPGEGDRVVYLAGASGGLWGAMMSAVGWLIINRSHLPPAQVREALQYMAFTILLNSALSMLPHVSAAAHFGGGFVGLLSAMLLQIHRYGPPARRAWAGMLLMFLPMMFLLSLAAAMENDSRLQPFLVREQKAQIVLRVGRMPEDMEPLEARAESFFAKESSKRDAADVEAIRKELKQVGRQAADARDWLKHRPVVGSAKGLKDQADRLLETIISLEAALEARAGGETIKNFNTLRKQYQDALSAWRVEEKK